MEQRPMSPFMRAVLIRQFRSNWGRWEKEGNEGCKEVAERIEKVIRDQGEPEDWEKIAFSKRPKLEVPE
jgi:hypothetical protein